MFQENYDWTYILAKQHHQELLAEAETYWMIRRSFGTPEKGFQGIMRMLTRLGNLLSVRLGKFSHRAISELDRADLPSVDPYC